MKYKLWYLSYICNCKTEFTQVLPNSCEIQFFCMQTVNRWKNLISLKIIFFYDNAVFICLCKQVPSCNRCNSIEHLHLKYLSNIITRWFAKLCKAELVSIYIIAGKSHLHILWRLFKDLTFLDVSRRANDFGHCQFRKYISKYLGRYFLTYLHFFAIFMRFFTVRKWANKTVLNGLML